MSGELDELDVVPHKIDVLQKSVCNFQLKYVDWQVSLTEKHRKLRLLLNDEATTSVSLGEAFFDFARSSSRMIVDMVGLTTTAIDRFYSADSRSSVLPRSCIKMISNGKILDVYRKNKDGEKNFSATENTAFVELKKGNRIFLENDIPSAAASGSYFNKRIDNDRAKDFLKDDDHSHDKWRRCWTDGDDQGISNEAFYKSTLVIPITLNGGVDRFKQETFEKFIRRGNRSETEHEKLLFGFLCLDHTDPFFFTKEDQAVGWIFADLLSISIVSDQVLTSASSTYSNVVTRIKSDPPSDLTLRDVLKNYISNDENSSRDSYMEESKLSNTSDNEKGGPVFNIQEMHGDIHSQGKEYTTQRIVQNGNSELGPELLEALQKALQDDDSKPAIDEFRECVEKDSGNTARLKQLWENVVKAAPGIGKIADAYSKLEKLFSSAPPPT